ncbi:methylenetetrahydrofolate--tRNA-(uracil(54)-C(5))-methyltransferase (FADH(2)-oxidizing) TrmFO [Intestinimonas sp. MSJ-38]|nr:methylenetetrahydrofolate--tRNA-(uracil(54)-C(5))-methyltransferase (FADH(2)-oxidizing) TrmFO [Intestinimonas sp. MSJ-38]MBU5431873.1 methylenetetrahydrofolate--tRNA-(uracil(54)-C(5))-methyltransferase (FADH(2)-oxidizing) TrmFO [Intestinimonas sp. MSJ-38]
MQATVIGAGLAGSEAAWQLACRGIEVRLLEMKPRQKSPAHKMDIFAELVCSNSFRSGELTNAAGLLKEELRRLGSLIVACADTTQVDAGGALAVDRQAFSHLVTQRLRQHPRIHIEEERVDAIPESGHVIVATGPLTEGPLAQNMMEWLGEEEALSFYDAAAPIVSGASLDMDKAYFASRYGKGTGLDYINCPMDKEQYLAFWQELCQAEEAPVHGFEDKRVFEGCMPVEVMARRGEDTLRFGPLKPIGLPDPKTGKEPYAVVQLRRENSQGTMYNLVGFQTHLRFPEQKRVFSMIPGLEKAEFLRYGVMHRNSYLCSPRVLDGFYRAKKDPRVMFAGQMTGVEGYVESTASGFACGLNMARSMLGLPLLEFSTQTAIGALSRHISCYEGKNFQPMNINFGLIDGLDRRVKGKRERYMEISRRSLEQIEAYRNTVMEGTTE